MGRPSSLSRYLDAQARQKGDRPVDLGSLPSSKLKPLSPKQRRFVEEYLVDFNGNQAAIRAGYSRKTARSQAARLLTNANVEAAVAAGAEKLSHRTGVTAERVLEELKCIGFLDPIAIFREDGSLKPITEWDESARRALSGCDVTELSSEEDVRAFLRKVRFWDKKGALELLGKHVGMYTDRLRVDGEVRFRFVDPGEADDAESWAEEGDE